MLPPVTLVTGERYLLFHHSISIVSQTHIPASDGNGFAISSAVVKVCVLFVHLPVYVSFAGGLGSPAYPHLWSES